MITFHDPPKDCGLSFVLIVQAKNIFGVWSKNWFRLKQVDPVFYLTYFCAVKAFKNRSLRNSWRVKTYIMVSSKCDLQFGQIFWVYSLRVLCIVYFHSFSVWRQQQSASRNYCFQLPFFFFLNFVVLIPWKNWPFTSFFKFL